MWTILFTFYLAFLAYPVKGTTELMSTEFCYGDPSQSIQVSGAVIDTSPEYGEKLCYYGPTSSEYYISIKINNLNLAKTGSQCPTFKLGMFGTTEAIVSQDDYFTESFLRPADLKIMVIADCNNYTSVIGKVYNTIAPGYSVELKYNPVDTFAPKDAYKFTITSYRQGASFICESGFFRCWDDKYKCIPESLQCDNYDNCFDNSDEEHYRCTGKIGVLQLPLFIIILIVCFLFVVFVAINIVLCLRSRRLEKAEKMGLIQDMNLHQPMLPVDYYPDVYSDQSKDPSVM